MEILGDWRVLATDSSDVPWEFALARAHLGQDVDNSSATRDGAQRCTIPNFDERADKLAEGWRNPVGRARRPGATAKVASGGVEALSMQGRGCTP